MLFLYICLCFCPADMGQMDHIFQASFDVMEHIVAIFLQGYNVNVRIEVKVRT